VVGVEQQPLDASARGFPETTSVPRHYTIQLYAYGYIFPERFTTRLDSKACLVRFQAPCFWPTRYCQGHLAWRGASESMSHVMSTNALTRVPHNIRRGGGGGGAGPSNTEYAVFLCKLAMRGTRLHEHEREAYVTIQKALGRRWGFVAEQARHQLEAEQALGAAERRVVLTQERAYWWHRRPGVEHKQLVAAIASSTQRLVDQRAIDAYKWSESLARLLVCMDAIPSMTCPSHCYCCEPGYSAPTMAVPMLYNRRATAGVSCTGASSAPSTAVRTSSSG
jgi:hypothetical protein